MIPRMGIFLFLLHDNTDAYRDIPADVLDAVYRMLSKGLIGRLTPEEVALKRVMARCLHPHPESNQRRSHHLRHCLK